MIFCLLLPRASYPEFGSTDSFLATFSYRHQEASEQHHKYEPSSATMATVGMQILHRPQEDRFVRL